MNRMIKKAQPIIEHLELKHCISMNKFRRSRNRNSIYYHKERESLEKVLFKQKHHYYDYLVFHAINYDNILGIFNDFRSSIRYLSTHNDYKQTKFSFKKL